MHLSCILNIVTILWPHIFIVWAIQARFIVRILASTIPFISPTEMQRIAGRGRITLPLRHNFWENPTAGQYREPI